MIVSDTLYERLYAMYRRCKFSHLVADDLADRASGVAEDWYNERGAFIPTPDDADHFVTFDRDGWFVEHSIACRRAGTLGTCAYNVAIREVAIDFDSEGDPQQLGRWRITNIDSEGIPSLERAPLTNTTT